MADMLDEATATNQRVKPREPSGSRISHTLPPELHAEASRRLGRLALVFAIGGLVAQIGYRALLAAAGTLDVHLHSSDLFGLGSVAIGLGVYALTRSGKISPKRLLDLGLVFEVAGAFGIAVSRLWATGMPAPSVATFALMPAECVWILLYPLVVPNAPNKVLTASLLAASAGPASAIIWSQATGTPVERPLMVAIFFLVSNYTSAVIAYVVARIVHRFNVRFKHAREVGSYALVEKLGEGGMGEVWRAKHRMLARPAAIKLIRADLLGSSYHTRDAILLRFEREAQDTATLRSPHTIDVYDFGITEDGDFYYVMELLDGISLERFVQLYGPMEPARAVYLLGQVCHSLREAHARGLIHRDIKPANLFVCRLGPDDDFVKVVDFGLVKHVEESGLRLTVEGSTAGTPAYMAPEIALGRPGVDTRADLYSLGCVAYYLLTGQPVFSGETPVATALAHVQMQPVPPSARSELDIPPALDALILECLAKDPANRPASAAELGRRLAATVPRDAWTADTAHAWWELRRANAAERSTSRNDDPAASVAVHPRWPRFDRSATKEQLA